VGSLAQFIFWRARPFSLCALVAIAAAFALPAQEPIQPSADPDAQPNAAAQSLQSARTLAALHGVVRDSASGEPLARALVSVEGDAATAALTDGDGKFEIPNLPVGPVIVSIRKPGYMDAATIEAAESIDVVQPASHNVMVAEDMADVEFSLLPTGAIRGQVDLSTGEAADGITVNLMRRVLLNGRAGWASAGNIKTRSDGTYRFGGLTAGVYEIYTEPSLDSEVSALPFSPDRSKATHQWGFATVYYPDARDPSGASRIRVAPGEIVQANLTLAREAFQNVTAAAILPQAMAGRTSNFEVQVADISGRALPYPARYEDKSKTIEATLPDGSYRLIVSTMGPQSFSIDGGGIRGSLIRVNNLPLQGSVDVQVAGQPVANLRVALTQTPNVQVQLNLVRSGSGEQSSQEGQFVVSVTQASTAQGQLPDEGIVSELAAGQMPGPLEGQAVQAGAYWVHTVISQKGFCESSFTAGGANLAREPLLIGPGGVQAPLTLNLRDDCAGLRLSLPEAMDTMKTGEEKYYSVYAIPDFDFTVDPQPVTLRPSSGGAISLDGLAPGNYHVYTLAGNAPFEYRNPAVLAAVPSQTVTLSPGATADLVVQTP
jgi:hypothetical protein